MTATIKTEDQTLHILTFPSAKDAELSFGSSGNGHLTDKKAKLLGEERLLSGQDGWWYRGVKMPACFVVIIQNIPQ